jgi:hypothetical protein
VDRSAAANLLEWFAAGLKVDPSARLLVWQGTREDKRIFSM